MCYIYFDYFLDYLTPHYTFAVRTINKHNMDNKNIKRQNEALKEIAEMQKDVLDFNAEIDRQIFEINHALSSRDYAQMQRCVDHTTHKHPDWWQYINNRRALLGVIFSSPATTLSLQKQALQNKKSVHGFMETLKRGAKLQVKWQLEDMQEE